MGYIGVSTAHGYIKASTSNIKNLMLQGVYQMMKTASQTAQSNHALNVMYSQMNSVDKMTGISKQERGLITSRALNGNLKSCIVLLLCFGIDIYIERDTIRKFIS